MRWVAPAATLLGIGWYFAICILLGTFAGRWLDGRFGTVHVFTIIGIFVGLAAALYGGYRLLTERLLRPGSGGRGPEGEP